jgi:membrane associated rhomboid family serine protease
MPSPDSSSDYDVPAYLLTLARLFGVNETRARWKLIALRRRLRRFQADLAPPSRRLDASVCPACGALQARDALECSACRERIGSSGAGRFLRSLGVSVPKAVSVSSALGVIMVVIYARMAIARPGQGILGWDGATLVHFGADFPPAVQAGQWWRLGTYMFLHIGLLHIGFNLMGLAQVGPTIEDLFGRGKMLFFFLVTGIIAGIGSELFNGYAVSAGASGALMGLIGMAAGWGHRSGTSLGHAVRDQMLKWAGYTMVFGLAVHANNWAHAFGFGAGALIGFAQRPLAVEAAKGRAADKVMGAIGVVTTLCLTWLCLVPPRYP